MPADTQIILNLEQQQRLAKHAGFSSVSQLTRADIIAALNAALKKLSGFHEALQKQENIQGENLSKANQLAMQALARKPVKARTMEAMEEAMDETNELPLEQQISDVLSDVNDILAAHPSLEADLSPEHRPDFLHKLTAEQQAWIYSQLPQTCANSPLTPALIAEALYRFFNDYGQAKQLLKDIELDLANPKSYRWARENPAHRVKLEKKQLELQHTRDSLSIAEAILQCLPQVAAQLALLPVERWVHQSYRLNPDLPAMDMGEEKAVIAVRNYLNQVRQGIAADSKRISHLIYLMQRYPLVAKEIASANDVLDKVLPIKHQQALINQLLQSPQGWLAALPCPRLSEISFEANEPTAYAIARAKIQRYLADHDKTKIQEAWSSIASSAGLTRFVLKPEQTGFFALIISWWQSSRASWRPQTIQQNLTADILLATAKNPNAPLGVRVAIRNAILGPTRWEQRLNDWGIRVGLSGKFTPTEKSELAMLDLKAPKPEVNPTLDLKVKPSPSERAIKSKFQAELIESATKQRSNRQAALDKLDASTAQKMLTEDAIESSEKSSSVFVPNFGSHRSGQLQSSAPLQGGNSGLMQVNGDDADFMSQGGVGDADLNGLTIPEWDAEQVPNRDASAPEFPYFKIAFNDKGELTHRLVYEDDAAGAPAKWQDIVALSANEPAKVIAPSELGGFRSHVQNKTPVPDSNSSHSARGLPASEDGVSVIKLSEYIPQTAHAQDVYQPELVIPPASFDTNSVASHSTPKGLPVTPSTILTKSTRTMPNDENQSVKQAPKWQSPPPSPDRPNKKPLGNNTQVVNDDQKKPTNALIF